MKRLQVGGQRCLEFQELLSLPKTFQFLLRLQAADAIVL
jgi:hypothetical protein